MMRVLFLLFSTLLTFSTFAQAPYTQKQFGWRIEKDLEYGTSVNYAGTNTPLTLDLYKPVGDDNLHRPLIVLVHGGAWLTGCKEHEAWLAEEMVQRGYVVASVNYRKGWHKDDFVGNPINPATFPGGNCLYATDSSELIRAIYRGQQDVKGAIRWLKARALQDSTCNHSVFISGSSAGAFVALAVALLDRPEEKPDACYGLSAAPQPAGNVSNCFDYNCITQTINPGGSALQRPDLGSIDGDMNQNGFNAEVLGVASFFGGVPYEALTKSWFQGPDTPAIYLYHQTCDGIVPFGYQQPMQTISANCNLGFTPWHSNYLHIFGNGAIAAYLQSLPDAPLFQTDFLECPPFNPALALFECIRYNDNGSYHYPHQPAARAQKLAEFFSPVVAGQLNMPACIVGNQEPARPWGLRVSPNPFQGELTVWLAEAPSGNSVLSLIDVSGKVIWMETRALQAGENRLQFNRLLPGGFYTLQINTEAGVTAVKLIKN